MFWFIIGFIGGVFFVSVVLTLCIIYSYGKSAERAHKEGWDMPN
jgi:hypothetical protein